MHSTENVDDGYLGSGKRVKAEVKKYGKENFEKVILEELPTRKALEEREREIVNDELLIDPLCLNLKNGGEGGGSFWNEEHKVKYQAAGTAARAIQIKEVGQHPNSISALVESTKGRNFNWSGRKHREETKAKMKASHKGLQDGEKNSQFGSCWVTDGVKPIKIKKEQLDEYIRNGYSRGRK